MPCRKDMESLEDQMGQYIKDNMWKVEKKAKVTLGGLTVLNTTESTRTI